MLRTKREHYSFPAARFSPTSSDDFKKYSNSSWWFSITRQSQFFSSPILISLAISLSIVLYGEVLVFLQYTTACGRQLGKEHGGTLLLVISDPQLTAEYSYDINFGPFLGLVKFYSDLYMRKYFQEYTTRYNLAGVIVLGDMFDGVTEYLFEKHRRTTWTAEEYKSLSSRWEWIFRSPLPFYNVSGNHDVGFNVIDQAALVTRYKETFGNPNYFFTRGEVDFIVIAATALYSDWTDAEFFEETMSFISSFKQRGKTRPRVLLTHIPFYRESTSCVPRDMNYGYITQIDRRRSKEVLDAIKPDYILSGDIHRHCYFLRDDTIHDYVVNTFSWMQGNPYPGAALLHIHTREETVNQEEVVTLHICSHHNQLLIYLVYLVLAVVLGVWLFFDLVCLRRKFYEIVAVFAISISFYLFLLYWS